ncbi:hypothetical protein ACN2WE_19360 [Streptomyces sp. cg28]
MIKHLARIWHAATEWNRTAKSPGLPAWGFFVERVTRIELAL